MPDAPAVPVVLSSPAPADPALRTPPPRRDICESFFCPSQGRRSKTLKRLDLTCGWPPQCTRAFPVSSTYSCASNSPPASVAKAFFFVVLNFVMVCKSKASQSTKSHAKHRKRRRHGRCVGARLGPSGSSMKRPRRAASSCRA